MGAQTEQLTKHMPEEIGLYLGYCRSLKFDHTADQLEVLGRALSFVQSICQVTGEDLMANGRG